MTEEESWLVIGKLAVETSGWDETNIEATRRRIEKWTDYECADAAVEEVIEQWTRPGRPPYAVLLDAYRTIRRREALSTPAIASATPARVVPVSEGRRIAARKYAEAARARDPQTDVHILSGFRRAAPSDAALDRILGSAGAAGGDDE